MANNRNGDNLYETNLFEGITLVSLLLRVGYYTEASGIASQLLVHFPKALPLHVAIGRAHLATAMPGDDTAKAIGHLRRVLDSDPENWRLRMETVLLYLRGDLDLQPRASQELWLALQTASGNRWLREMISRLPEIPLFERAQLWNKAVTTGQDNETGDIEPQTPVEDEGGIARLYLRRTMPWMAIQYFDEAIRRLPAQSIARQDLKTGLLLALWQDGQVKRASSLASEMLLDQPQLIFPRLLLTAHLSEGAMRKNPQALVRLIEPVWRLDPLLERAGELAFYCGLEIPENLWPHPDSLNSLTNPASPWHDMLGYNRTVQIRLGKIDREWLDNLLQSSRALENRTPTGDSHQQIYFPNREVSFSLLELNNLETEIPENEPVSFDAYVHPDESQFTVQKGGGRSPGRGGRRSGSDLDKIAASISEVEWLLYGSGNSRRPSRPAQRKKIRNQPGGRITPKGGSKNEQKGGILSQNHEAKPVFSLDPNVIASSYSSNVMFSPKPDEAGPSSFRQANVLVITSEHAFTSKYGSGAFHKVRVLLEELVDVMRGRGFDARLMLVDNQEALRKSGFEKLEPVRNNSPEQIRSIINAALPEDNTGSSIYRPLSNIFIIGGPDIIPFWKLPNPSFDSDREVLSDNPYGAHDNTYLLPERAVGRLPDDGGAGGSANLQFLLKKLSEVIARQKTELVAPKVVPPLPLRLMEAFLPASRKMGFPALDDAIRFEQEWLQSAQESNEQFLDKARANRLYPFFYTAEAWKLSTETLHDFMGGTTKVSSSPPVIADSFDTHMIRQSRVLHFNLHGFRDTPNWYGQSQASRIVTSPEISSLPLAFTTSLSSEVKTPGTVVFSEACYGGYLPGKGINESIALTLLDKGAAAFVGSTVISYGSAGPELSCAGHLAYFFWKAILQQGCSFGQALQMAKVEYARERLASGHNLTGDDAKTLLEFVLMGDPTIGIHAVSPVLTPTNSAAPAKKPAGQNVQPVQKGGISQNPASDKNNTPYWEEEQKLRGVIKGLWNRFNRPQNHYHPVEYNKLPADLVKRIESILEWLIPGANTLDPAILQTMIDLGNSSGQARATFKTNTSSRKFAKGGTPTGFADWFLEDEDEDEEEKILEELQENEAHLLLTGKRSMQTIDGRYYQQTFHLTTDFSGQNIYVNLSKGKG